MTVKSSPKRNKKQAYVASGIYDYYAGFSDYFVKEQLEAYIKDHSTIVLDPWNGSGTTTLVSEALGVRSYGFDINPVMVIIAKAKLYNKKNLKTSDIISKIRTQNIRVVVNSSDPLHLWFHADSVLWIRMLERAIFDDFFQAQYINLISELNDISSLTCEHCFLYVCFFKLIKSLTKDFVGTNPTWVKSKIEEEDKKDTTYLQLAESLINIIEEAPYLSTNIAESISTIRLCDSTSLSLDNESVDLVITSPPYCTRIDYAVYTIVELALLGVSGKNFLQLRKKMIGTPTITDKESSNNEELILPKKCSDLLSDISTHSSKAASTYYYKTYCQYFMSMLKSIMELYRVLGKDSKSIVVIQDSWFKDIHIDMSSLMEELFIFCGFALVKKDIVHVKSTMSYMNQKMFIKNKQKKYIESILVFRKV